MSAEQYETGNFKIKDSNKYGQVYSNLSLGLTENFGESANKAIYCELWWNMCKNNPGGDVSSLMTKAFLVKLSEFFSK